jgi:hypothetical protein
MDQLLYLELDDLFGPGQFDADLGPDGQVLINSQDDELSILDGLDADRASTLLDGGSAGCKAQRRNIQKRDESNQAQKMDLRARNRLAQARHRQKAKVQRWL